METGYELSEMLLLHGGDNVMLHQSLSGKITGPQTMKGLCSTYNSDRVEAGYPGIDKHACMAKGDACWDDTQSNVLNCFLIPIPVESSLLGTLQAAVDYMETVEQDLLHLMVKVMVTVFSILDDNGDGAASREELH